MTWTEGTISHRQAVVAAGYMNAHGSDESGGVSGQLDLTVNPRPAVNCCAAFATAQVRELAKSRLPLYELGLGERVPGLHLRQCSD